MNDELTKLVKSLFDDYLNKVEVSDNDNEFHPTYISTCRVMKVEPLNKLLNRMRELSGAGPDPLLRKQGE